MSGKATTLRWSPGRRDSTKKSTTPTIKNHTATRIGSKLFVFGGYDGVRNHHAVHILDSITLEWREAVVQVGKTSALFMFLFNFKKDKSYRFNFSFQTIFFQKKPFVLFCFIFFPCCCNNENDFKFSYHYNKRSKK